MKIEFRMQGPAVVKSMPLHVMLDGLGAVQSIFDKTYLGLMERKRVKQFDRKQFYIATDEVKHGSIHTNLEIVLTGTQMLLPFYQSIGPENIWEITSSTFKFLHLVYEKFRADPNPDIHLEAKGNGRVELNIDNSKHTYDNCVFNIGPTVLPYYQKIGGMIKNGEVDKVQLGHGSRGEISLDKNAADFFEMPAILDKHPQSIVCEIFQFSKFDNAGKLVVGEKQAIPAGKYNFRVIGKQDVTQFIHAMLKKRVTVSCLVERAVSPLQSLNQAPKARTMKIQQLQVIAVE